MSDELNNPAPQNNTGGDADGGNNQGESAPSFLELLPEDLRGNESLSGYRDAGALAKDYLSLKEADANRPKAPDSPEAYEIKYPDGVEFDKELEKSFRTEAHKAGLTQDQIQTVITFDQRRLAAQIEKNKADIAAANKVLQDAWGNKYNENLDKAKRTAKAIFGDVADEFLAASGLGNNPKAAIALLKASGRFTEDTFHRGDGSGGGGPKSLAERLYPQKESK